VGIATSNKTCATYRVQFVVETTGVAYWLSVVVTPP